MVDKDFLGTDNMSIKKTKNTLKGVAEYVTDVIPSPEEIRDGVGDFIAQLLCGPRRWEKREELRKRLIALKDALTGAIGTDSVMDDISRAIDRFEETVGEALCEAEKNLKKARLLAVSCALALGAVLLDKRWRVLFDVI